MNKNITVNTTTIVLTGTFIQHFNLLNHKKGLYKVKTSDDKISPPKLYDFL